MRRDIEASNSMDAHQLPLTGSGVGRFRDKWAIRRHVEMMGTTLAAVADSMKINRKQVYDTVNGLRNDRRVLAKLRDLGCSDEMLSLPMDMREE